MNNRLAKVALYLEKLPNFLLGSCLFFSFAASAGTVSEKYNYLVNDNEARMLFTTGQMDKLKASLVKSSNFKSVTKLLTPLYDGMKIRKTLKLDSHHNLEWIDHGIEKASQIVLTDLTQSAPNQELYSNFQEGMGIADIIIDFSLSPDGQYIDVISSEYGSIDQAVCFIVNVTTHEVVTMLNLAENLRAWTAKNTLMYAKLNEDGSESIVRLDLASMQESNFNGYILGNTNDLVLLENDSEKVKWFSIQNKNDGSIVNLDWPYKDTPHLIGNDTTHAYFYAYDSIEKKSKIIKLSRSSLKAHAIEKPNVLVTEPELFLEKAWFDRGTIFTQVRAGTDRWIKFFTTDGIPAGQIAAPDCCSVLGVSWASASVLRFAFSSPLFANLAINYDTKTQTWEQDPAETMLNDRDLHLVSEVVYAVSKDGTKIPTRISRLRDLSQDASHATVIQVYGGFNLAGYADPSFDPSNLEFIKRGGIYVGPAIRGGNEFGPDWHTQAMLTNKIKTYEDLACVSDLLVSLKWTQPNFIITRGTSNGGLTVAATAQLFPDKFGLIIPIAGVHDLLAKDVLDSVTDGWSDEFGSDDTLSDFLKTISPVENAANLGGLRYLIVDGANDTRVNPAHSVKFAKALEDLGGHSSQVYLLTMQNAGHWLESVSYQNSIGLKTEIAIWTQIYDLAGFSAKPTHFAQDFN